LICSRVDEVTCMVAFSRSADIWMCLQVHGKLELRGVAGRAR
jgi:hypothetical protein